MLTGLLKDEALSEIVPLSLTIRLNSGYAEAYYNRTLAYTLLGMSAEA